MLNISFRNTGDPCQPQWESPREASKDRPQLHFVSVFTKEDDRQHQCISPWNGSDIILKCTETIAERKDWVHH